MVRASSFTTVSDRTERSVCQFCEDRKRAFLFQMAKKRSTAFLKTEKAGERGFFPCFDVQQKMEKGSLDPGLGQFPGL